MTTQRRIRLAESEAMEGGVRCPKCGSYTSFGDIVAAGGCGGGEWRGGDCDASLSLDLVLENPE
ncbi:hypothetical protein [Salinirubrum litoreum]|uniref:Uncharacterized protein n=1 Tax=Salinirubrum litoreum TaxID=1126234 RepID=A0ABD5R5Y6_9EURY|nr:hypothetical protein [Salinirubrum litoreum]